MAGPAIQQPQLPCFAKAHARRQIAGAPFAVVHTLGILTAKPREFVHGLPSVFPSPPLLPQSQIWHTDLSSSITQGHQLVLYICPKLKAIDEQANDKIVHPR